MTIKIEAMDCDLPQPFAYGNVFARERVGGRPRIRVGVDEAQDAIVAALAGGLRGPFQLLYVMHTTRTGAELGRYESPELTNEDVEEFPREFGLFICEDSRHDLWVARMTTMRRSSWIDTILSTRTAHWSCSNGS